MICYLLFKKNNNNKNFGDDKLGTKVDYDAIIVGAGFAGLALIHHLKKLGISLKVFDKASGIGGTWNWNKYPGAATDSEGYYYCLSFSKEIMQKYKNLCSFV